jgi:FixJ family two-component response regulator
MVIHPGEADRAATSSSDALRLSSHERAVLAPIAAGLGIHASAAQLGWAPDDVLLHLAGAVGALRACSVADALRRAEALGLVRAPRPADR